jgi:phage terminase large subunit-like protein
MWNPNKKILACRQRVKELLADKSGGYYWDATEAVKPVRFIEASICYWQGPKAGEKVVLEDFQKELLGYIFGVRKKDGSRLFTDVYIQLPRANSKTFLSSCIALYTLFFGPQGSEIILAANSREQASKYLFGDCYHICSSSPVLSQHLGDGIERHRIYYKENRSEIRSISRQNSSAQGGRTSLAILDELHEFVNNDFHDTLLTSLGKVKDSLFVKITTSGSNLETICYQNYELACKVLDGTSEMDNFLPWIVEADEELAWDSDEAWQQANPMAGLSIQTENILNDLRKAREVPAYRHTYERMRLNRWITRKERKWFNQQDWKDCFEEYCPNDLLGRDCFVGVDLSQTTDVSAVVFAFPFPDGVVKTLAYGFLPQEGIAEKEKVDKCPYQLWERDGWMFLTNGSVVDYVFMADFIMQKAKLFNIKALLYDRTFAQTLINELEGAPFPVIDFIQNANFYHNPSCELERLILQHKIRHNGNKLFANHIGTVELEIDKNGKKKPIKNTYNKSGGNRNRIDTVCATIFALDGVMRNRKSVEIDASDSLDGLEKIKDVNIRALLGI